MEQNELQKESLPNGVKENENMETSTSEQEESQKQLEGEIQTFPIFIKKCSQEKGDEEPISLQVTHLDNIQDIKQFLYESPDTCHITHYNLYLDGNKLNDFSDLADIPELKDNSVLEMKEAPYDERSLKFHVRRLRELLSSPSSMTSTSLFSKIYKEEKENEGTEEKSSKKSEDKPEEALFDASLKDFFPSDFTDEKVPSCLKSLCFSGWNPPPGNRKLKGDLIYLSVVTLEKKTFHITGWTKGFFVNSSTDEVFDPNPAEKPCRSHSLSGLLSQLSSGFKREFQNILTMNVEKHPFELYPIPFPSNGWVSQEVKHNFDLNRAEDSLLFSTESEIRGPLRDWNEEYQSCRELPSETLQERIIRDRAIIKVNCDFVEAATKGACAIIEKTVTPINPLDPERAHMYIFNNIFFSYAMDSRDFYKEYGGDRAAYISVNNDLKGVRAFNQADIRGLYTLATAIIDYRGHRLVAQSIIPGILQREQNSQVVYGSIDNGKKITSDPEFHELVSKAAKRLSIKEHTVIDEEGNPSKLCCSVESKGIKGTDGRKYILDLLRVTPRDVNYQGKEHMLTILRPELIYTYYEHLKRQHILAKQLEAKKKAEEKKKNEESKKTEETNKEEKNEKGKEEKEEDKEEEKLPEIEDDDFTYPEFNPNVLCSFKFSDDPQVIKESEDLVKTLGDFLVKVVIPSMIEEFALLLSIPADGISLTSSMHARGINMRYLGKVCSLSEKVPVLHTFAMREMITRAAKHILRAILRETEDYQLASTISHFLNCLLANPSSKKKQTSQKKKKAPKKTSTPNIDQLTPQTLWDCICWEVYDRFQYELPDRESIGDILGSISTLRSICYKVGIQIVAKDYDFKGSKVTSTDDILNLFPKVKHVNPETEDGRSLLDAGKSFLQQGRLDIAYELLNESLQIFHQVYGPMHKDTANCYGNLAMVLYHVKDLVQAIDHQQKATIINERVLGLDHPDTCQSYANLGLFCQQAGKPKQALNCIEHFLYLSLLISGPSHPEIPATYTNLAVMLQEMKRPNTAMAYLLQALKQYEMILGSNHIQMANLYHAIALAYSQMNEYKEALNYEKKNYAILHAHKIPETDSRVSESNLCLKQFTAKAVQKQMQIQKQQIGQTKVDLSRLNTLNKGSQTVVNNVGSSSTVPMGSRPLEEILKFIYSKSPSIPERSFKERNQVQTPTKKVTKQQPTPAKTSQTNETPNGNGNTPTKPNKQKKKKKKN